jgi:hypothetical protein
VNYLELRKKLKKMRLTAGNFGKVLEISPNAVSRWKTREVPVYGKLIVDLLERLPVEEREKFLTERLGEEF